MSPIILKPTSLSFAGERKPASASGAPAGTMNSSKARRRRSSSLMYTEPPESMEHISDQAALPNLNAEWVNAKGQQQV